ncbi:hypothetical protein GA0115246_101271, partial [Streptomyces sp. SolWspMP-sol7th]
MHAWWTAQPPGGGAGRAARERGAGQVAVAEGEGDAVERDAERVGGDLREDGAGTRADVGGVDPYRVRAVGARGGLGRRGGDEDRVRRRRDAGAEQEASLAARAGARVAGVPAEAFRAFAQALDEVAAAEGPSRVGLRVGLVADPQFDGVDPGGLGEFVHGRFECEHAGGLAGGAHPGGAGDVEGQDAVGRAAVRRGVHDAGGHGGLFDELLDPRGVRDDLVGQGAERAVLGGPEPHAVQGRGAVPDDGGQLAARQGEFDGPPDVQRRERGEDGLRARGALGAEAAADVRGVDGDVLFRHAEERGEGGADGVGALAAVVDDESSRLPRGDARVRLHGVVVERGDAVGAVDADGSGGEGVGEVAALAVGGIAAVRVVRAVDAGVSRAQFHVVRVGLVSDAQGEGPGAGGFQGLGDDDGDVPAEVRDARVLEDVQRGVVGCREAAGVLVAEDGDDPGQAQDLGVVDGGDASGGDGRGDGPGVREARREVLGGVAGGPGDLGPALGAGDVGAEDGG